MSVKKIISDLDLLMGANPQRGFIKCRLLHMNGISVIQPDILFGDNSRKGFFSPRFFDPNQISFFEDGIDDFCRLTLVTSNKVCLRVAFYKRDWLATNPDGSAIYRCVYGKVDGPSPPKPDGRWRRRGSKFQLFLYHHTDRDGAKGIATSHTLWGSRRNIQGNLWLRNISYGYFTCIDKIKSEIELLEIAMSSSGLTGLVPTNAPYHPLYARMIRIPVQMAAQRSEALGFWIDSALIAPNHLWLHKPLDKPAYYEIVLPKVFRVGVRAGANLNIIGNEISVPTNDRKIFEYVIVGNAEDYYGLEAPYHEEDTTSLALIDKLAHDEEIIGCWKRKANTNQFDGRAVEHAELEADKPTAA